MVKRTELLSAGAISVLVAIIGHPLWKSLNFDLGIWIIGISMLGIAGVLNWFNRYEFLQILLGLWGFLWFALFFFEVFPAFSISLI